MTIRPTRLPPRPTGLWPRPYESLGDYPADETPAPAPANWTLPSADEDPAPAPANPADETPAPTTWTTASRILVKETDR